MNAETGRIYEGQDEIEAARERGEPLIELSIGILDDLEKRVEELTLNREERRNLKFGRPLSSTKANR